MYHNSKHTNYIQLQVYKYTCTYTQNRNTIKETRIITPFPPPTLEKKVQLVHPHTQHTDSHTNTITQKEKWVYYTHYSLRK